MPKPTTRVLSLLELLQSREVTGGAELARELEVDRRTLRRYIVMLEEIGIPIVTTQGRFGGYQVVPGFKLPPMIFSDQEALALAVGLMAARGLGLAESMPAVASARAKMERVFPDQAQAAAAGGRRKHRARTRAPGGGDRPAGAGTALHRHPGTPPRAYGLSFAR